MNVFIYFAYNKMLSVRWEVLYQGLNLASMGQLYSTDYAGSPAQECTWKVRSQMQFSGRGKHRIGTQWSPDLNPHPLCL